MMVEVTAMKTYVYDMMTTKNAAKFVKVIESLEMGKVSRGRGQCFVFVVPACIPDIGLIEGVAGDLGGMRDTRTCWECNR